MNDPDECAVCLEFSLEMNPLQENVRGGNGRVINPQPKDRLRNNKKKKRSKKRAPSASDEVKDKKAKHVQSADCIMRQLESECMPKYNFRAQ
jgi:hypothetical protein